MTSLAILGGLAVALGAAVLALAWAVRRVTRDIEGRRW